MFAGFIWISKGPVADSCNAVLNLQVASKSGRQALIHVRSYRHGIVLISSKNLDVTNTFNSNNKGQQHLHVPSALTFRNSTICSRSVIVRSVRFSRVIKDCR